MAGFGCRTADNREHGLTGHRFQRVAISSAQRGEIYRRADNEFARAALVKPAEETLTNSFAGLLAPLLLQEAQTTNATATTNPSRVFYQTNQVVVNDRPHDAIMYWWNRGDGGAANPTQGFQIILDHDGRPAAWAVLRDSTGAVVLFVSRKIEEAARTQFGGPLPGRRFAIERSQVDAPEVVVARIVEDGPVPMGPIIYLKAGSQDVSTLICRCMSSQADSLAGMAYYRLESAQAPTGLFVAARLASALRWPKDF